MLVVMWGLLFVFFGVLVVLWFEGVGLCVWVSWLVVVLFLVLYCGIFLFVFLQTEV